MQNHQHNSQPAYLWLKKLHSGPLSEAQMPTEKRRIQERETTQGGSKEEHITAGLATKKQMRSSYKPPDTRKMWTRRHIGQHTIREHTSTWLCGNTTRNDPQTNAEW
ncbi:unnamed protein product [Arctogadus glacialis]